MKKFAVIGHPISHSKSPALHQAGFIDLEIDAEFLAVDVLPKNLETWLKKDFQNFEGAAVTIPHKENIRKYLDQESMIAQKIGAVNTLFWQNGKICGTNTDVVGVLKSIINVFNPSNQNILILGAGGAARATIFGLQITGANVFLWNRTKEKAIKIANEFDPTNYQKIKKSSTSSDCENNVSFLESIKKADIKQIQVIDDFSDSKKFDLVINTTSVGLHEWKSVVPENFWHKSHVAFDIVYDPLETKFLSDAEKAGAITISGDKLLVYQALEQFKMWNNVELDPEVMEHAFFEN